MASRDLALGAALGFSSATTLAVVLMRKYLREELRPPKLIHSPDERLEEDQRLLEEVKLSLRDYWPHPVLEFSGYMSTFYSGFWAVMPSMHGTGSLETIALSDGGEVSLHWYDPPRAETDKVLLVLPGLNNNSRTSFVQATMRHIRSEGFQAVALNYRGLTSDLKTPKVASAESWADIHEVAQHILKVKPNCELFGLGFSLGGGMLLRHLGFEGERTLFKAAVTVAAPVDFTGACAALESSRRKLFINFMISQGAKAFMLQGLVKSKFRDRVDLKRVLLATRLSQIESALICPLMGYATPAEYYEANNPRPFLHKVSVPTLVVNAEDDPVISLHTLPFDELKRNPRIYVAVTKRGGHIGWGSGGLGAGAWTDSMAAHFLQAAGRSHHSRLDKGPAPQAFGTPTARL
ncbi:unnamed protein product [Durusdinium trenchii]|uniref:Phospholipase ABHD3 (Abhydrolase domain-containing protein 3) n=2 Tax=Durusdinium trenchii TaxID=1381693 RepID=A0ABP0QZH5_9DINO